MVPDDFRSDTFWYNCDYSRFDGLLSSDVILKNSFLVFAEVYASETRRALKILYIFVVTARFTGTLNVYL